MTTSTSSNFLQLGHHTHKIPLSLHAKNRKKLIDRMKALPSSGVIVLQGGESEFRHETDHEHLFRQESFFHYLFGVQEPDCFGAIDIENEKSILFVPKLPPEYAIWMGKIQPPGYFKEIYSVDDVHYVDDICSVLSDLKPSTVFTLKGKNTDSGNEHKEATFKGIENFKVDNSKLWHELVECRVIKSQEELDLMRYVNKITSEAHKEVMKSIKPGMMEFQMESIFLHNIYFHGGCRHASYTCICASGHNGSVLHYGHAGAPNSKQLKDGEIVVFDMGGEHACYGADVTRSFPVNGKFTADQRAIYEGVLAAQEAVMRAIKPGVKWSDMHTLAYQVILSELKRHGLLNGSVEEMIEHNVAYVFMPHGLGHFLGIDTHDVGGYPLGIERINKPGFRSLRTARALEEGMVLTVEPGIYFIDALLDSAMKDPVTSKFLNIERVNSFRGFGGVRIEDNVIITHNGCENMTTAPRTVAEIEAWMALSH